MAIALLMGVAVLAFIALVDPRGELHSHRQLFGPTEDGHWAALSIDGQKVSPSEYRVTILDRRVVGGRDGCNDWAYAGSAGANGERLIETTLQYCPDNDIRRAYHLLSKHSKGILLPDGKLQLTFESHQGIFARCEWQTIKSSGPGWTSRARQCVVAPS